MDALGASVSGGSVMARGIPQVVEEILYNLCDNAIAYTRPGGSVSVTVEQTAEGGRVTVADTGIGIPASVQDRVFERFYRVDQSHGAGGTGLGLSIVKHGASYLGARVELESEEGKGSTFTVVFFRRTMMAEIATKAMAVYRGGIWNAPCIEEDTLFPMTWLIPNQQIRPEMANRLASILFFTGLRRWARA